MVIVVIIIKQEKDLNNPVRLIMTKKEISIIIPTLNEEKTLARCLESIAGNSDIEIIVSDGGSTDETREIIKRHKDVKVVSSLKGRGVQMNTGASYSNGEILLFLHADCIISPRALLNIGDVFQNKKIVGGAFRIKLLSDKLPYRFIETGINLRSKLFKLPYGDQGLFVKRSVFMEIGCFKKMNVCEDLDFIYRLKKRGKIAILDEKILSSVRRWEMNGIVRTTFRNQFLLASYVIRQKAFNFFIFFRK
ncbi:MAG: TIGR04283 family arsenosugar biosynthesis glycosyltransferase [Candidatus Brocadiaceae bacterium]|nr:TIGR04283 family arsenosugar biosynthesis glycosyltransferase [Candidatus Brocadiaceae bacterium]